MSMYTPQIKEEVSENAKMLVMEEDGKVYRTNMNTGGYDLVIVGGTFNDNTPYIMSGTFSDAITKIKKGNPISVQVFKTYRVMPDQGRINFDIFEYDDIDFFENHFNYNNEPMLFVSNSSNQSGYRIYPDNHVEFYQE